MKYDTRGMLAAAGLSMTLAMAAPAHAAEVFVNGGFETGNFSGWTVGPNPGTVGCDQPWTVRLVGSECLNVGPPVGVFGAYTALNGGGPLERTISQSFNLPSVAAATLSWSEAADWLVNAGPHRTFSIDLRDSMGAILANLWTETFSGNGSFGLTGHMLDITGILAPFAGQDVNIAFTTIVPDIFTGPAGFLLDAVSLDVTGAVIPEPATLALVGLALVGVGLGRRKAISGTR